MGYRWATDDIIITILYNLSHSCQKFLQFDGSRSLFYQTFSKLKQDPRFTEALKGLEYDNRGYCENIDIAFSNLYSCGMLLHGLNSLYVISPKYLHSYYKTRIEPYFKDHDNLYLVLQDLSNEVEKAISPEDLSI